MKKKQPEKRAVKNNILRRKRKNRTSYELTGIFLVLFSVLAIVSLFGYDVGFLGAWMTDGFRLLFGVGSLCAASAIFVLGLRYTLTGRECLFNRRIWLVSSLGFFFLCGYHQVMAEPGKELVTEDLLRYGGIFAGAVVWGLRMALGYIGSSVFLLGLIVANVLLVTHWSVSRGAQKISEKTEKKLETVAAVMQEKKAAWQMSGAVLLTDRPKDFLFHKKEQVKEESPFPTAVSETENETGLAAPIVSAERRMDTDEPVRADRAESIQRETEPEHEIEIEATVEEGQPLPTGYRFPPLEILRKGAGNGLSPREDARKKTELLESALASFGVKAHVSHVTVGPSVTRYELEPAPGVRVSKIENLADDIALQLAATHIRIEAPIPGKSAVGIEVPNGQPAEVPLRDVLSSQAFGEGKGDILVALGKDIAGHAVVADLSKMPHLLIAGATGSGKSVCINTLITSILYHSRPDEVKLILIDPKVVELSVYNGIPHLRTEVVTDAKKAAGALHWAVNEMEERYKRFSAARVRDIGGYNKSHPEDKMPFIVVIIDELADLMMAAADSVEQAICRLAQKARAAGIHLVLATQRPSVDVITGLIKANIPSRISFAVSSQVDSRTVLDKAGAEKLLGKGDMLFDPSGAPNPIRIQGAFISDEEVEAVTEYIRRETLEQEEIGDEPLDFSLPASGETAGGETGRDELLRDAAEWVLDTKRASASALQRRFRVGFTRAGRLMDSMESLGIVGPADGTKPREILMTKDQLVSLFRIKED